MSTIWVVGGGIWGGRVNPMALKDALLPGPMASTVRGRALEAGAPPRRVPPQNPGRGGQTHRPAGWKRRRPRPRLSHKGPMPF
ncbi:unnamed protein product [Arctogadus glacialis]